MGFATAWLAKRALFPELIKETPDNHTGIIVVVPAYNEPRIEILLDSLALCTEPFCNAEVLIIVNAQHNADKELLLNNRRCIENIEAWKAKNRNCFFRLFVFDAGQPSIDGWGVGLARKTGMDEALRRFNAIGNPEGVIASLDADCTVEENYFVSIADHLLNIKEQAACSIYFEHPLSGNDFPQYIFDYIILYELHLRYYVRALEYTGFPYAFHTVGSAIAVKAFPYIKAGGMNRRQAGEDFYFIQKLVQMGGYFALNNTTVHPSPRESLRVPFGTGAAISRLINKPEDPFLTYNFKAFIELRSIFNTAGNLYQVSSIESRDYYRDLPDGLRSFIGEKEWISRTGEINNNTAGYVTFIKRFFAWFNMFRIVKYLNHVHNGLYDRRLIPVSVCDLLASSGHQIPSADPLDLLIYLRSVDKKF